MHVWIVLIFLWNIHSTILEYLLNLFSSPKKRCCSAIFFAKADAISKSYAQCHLRIILIRASPTGDWLHASFHCSLDLLQFVKPKPEWYASKVCNCANRWASCIFYCIVCIAEGCLCLIRSFSTIVVEQKYKMLHFLALKQESYH